jgi:hypothetical protein
MSRKKRKAAKLLGTAEANKRRDDAQVRGDTEPDWSHECEVCGQRPIVPVTGLCGPCTFGEAETIGGNW